MDAFPTNLYFFNIIAICPENFDLDFPFVYIGT